MPGKQENVSFKVNPYFQAAVDGFRNPAKQLRAGEIPRMNIGIPIQKIYSLEILGILDSLPKTNSSFAPQKCWLEGDFPCWNGPLFR